MSLTPRQGPPTCALESIVQALVRALARVDVYTAVVVTLTLVVVVWTQSF